MGNLKSLSLYGLVLFQSALARCCHTKKADTSWHQYVRAPTSNIVKPKSIHSNYTAGKVTNPEGLLSGNSTTTLSRGKNDAAVPTIVVDFGQDVVGLLEIDFASSTNASTGFPGLKLAFSETLEFLGNTSDFTRSNSAGTDPPKLTSGTDQIAVKNKAYTWVNQWGCEHGSQVCADGLHGFRYVKIELDALSGDAPYTSIYGEVVIKSVKLHWSAYLGTPDTYTGWFECSDKDLTQWWYDGAYTTEMGTDVFRNNDTDPRGAASASLDGKWVLHDGAKRDRDPYMGDLAVAALTAYVSHDFPEPARNVMEDLALHQRDDGWIPPASIGNYDLKLFDYPLYWITCGWDHVMYTGNVSYIQTYYPVLEKVLDKYYVAHTDNTTSLLVRQDGYGDFAFIPRDGSATYYSALYVLALNRAADLATLLSKPADAARWRERAAKTSAGVLEHLWDASAGAFYDRKCSGKGCSAHAQDGNSIAILAGITSNTSSSSPKYAESALAYLAKATAKSYGHAFYDAGGNELGDGFSDRVYPFISYFETAARFESGMAESAVAQIKATYAHMAVGDPGITMWEGVGVNGSKYEGAFTSAAHGWSTGVTPLLTTYVLGVKPLKPGFKEWVVQPRPSKDLTWAKGVVPTPYGPLSVSWQRNGTDGKLVVSVTAPPGTNGTVIKP
ncbi:hypothetical protein ABKA04_001086 [Annulohypoxylon sp. FPYF3050]